MSFEHRDERLQDLQIGGSGQVVPDDEEKVRPDVDPDGETAGRRARR